MFVFGLYSFSDDLPSDLSDKSQLKCEKGPLSHQKMKCFFWITFNFDDRLSDLSDKIQSKCEKMKKLDLKTR